MLAVEPQHPFFLRSLRGCVQARSVASARSPAPSMAAVLHSGRLEGRESQARRLRLPEQQALLPAVDENSLNDRQDLSMLFTALALTETVYRVSEGRQAAAAHFRSILKDLPTAASTSQLFWGSSDTQRYCTVEDAQALYVGLMGSLHISDWATNVNVLFTDIWHPATAAQDRPAVHRGYLGRSRHIPIEQMYADARSRGKQLVLCGHSLGGAVAALAALRLLQQLNTAEASNVSVIAFAAPAVGNSALARAVSEAGWANCFSNFLLPEDFVPRILTPMRGKPSPSLPDLRSVAALRRSPGKQRVASNIQPFNRRSSSRQPHVISSPQLPTRSPATATAARPESASSRSPAERWHQWLAAGLLGSVTSAASIPHSYQPFGHEVHLFRPSALGGGLHPEVLAGMTRSLLCPNAHRMPSYRARILDVINASSAPEPSAADGRCLTQKPEQPSLSGLGQLLAVVWSLIRQLMTPTLTWSAASCTQHSNC